MTNLGDVTMKANRIIQTVSQCTQAVAPLQASSGVSAAILTVGAAGSGCNHLTVQAARKQTIAGLKAWQISRNATPNGA